MKKLSEQPKGTAPIGTPLGNGTHVLYFGNARLCDLEGRFDLPFGHILDRVAKDIDLRTIRGCMEVAMQAHHGDMSPADVEALIEDAGIPAVTTAIVKEINATMLGKPARKKAA